MEKKIADPKRPESRVGSISPGDKKIGSKKVHRLVGTPDYMPPEIIEGASTNNFSIDWWGLGVILFEFLCGVPPFNGDSPEEIYDNIVKRKIPWDQITIGYGSDCVSPEAADLINKLLTLDPENRLGANDAMEIKKHPFFNGIDWKNLRTQKAPIIPEQTSAGDTSNFVRLQDDITENDKENPLTAMMQSKESKPDPNVLAAKRLLAASSEKFDMFNYAHLYSHTLKEAEETLNQRDKELEQFEECEDGIFDEPEDIKDNYDVSLTNSPATQKPHSQKVSQKTYG